MLLVQEIFSFDGATKLKIPLYSAVSAGVPSPADDYVEMALDLNEHLVFHPAATFFVRVVWESMIDTCMESGDLLVVDKSLTAKDGDIVMPPSTGSFWSNASARTVSSSV